MKLLGATGLGSYVPDHRHMCGISAHVLSAIGDVLTDFRTT